MKDQDKLLLYKWGSVSLILLDILMLWKGAFFSVSAKITETLQMGKNIEEFYIFGLTIDGSAFESGMLHEVIESLSRGKITLFEFQKIYSVLYDFAISTSSSSGNSAIQIVTNYYIIQVLYLVMLLFSIIGIVEALRHFMDDKLNCIWLISDLWLLCATMGFYLRGGIYYIITPIGIAIMVIPIIETLLWNEYETCRDKINGNMEAKRIRIPEREEQLQDNDNAFYDKVEDWKKYLSQNKILVITIAIIFGLEVISTFVGFTWYEEMPLLIYLLENIIIGFMIISAYHNEWKIIAYYGVVSFLGKLLFYSVVLQYYTINYIITFVGYGLILMAVFFIMMKITIPKNRLAIITGVITFVKAILIPLFNGSYYPENEYTIISIIGILLPVVCFIIYPEIIYKFINFGSAINVQGNQNENSTENKNTAGEFYEIKKMENALKENKNQLREAYIALGVKCCNAQNNDINSDLKTRIQEIDRENDEIRKRLNMIKGVKICPTCQTQNPNENSFCSKCGTKLDEESAVCSKCGEPLNQGDVYCSNCGTKL
jgi:hypothetical protein